MKTVYFVRHGQSEANASQGLQWPESPLTEQGRSEARAVAERAQKLPVEAIVASPYARAKETAEIIGGKIGMPVEFSELFVERVKPSSLKERPHDDPDARNI